MKRIISLIILAAFATTAMLISFSSNAEAIPAFARKEGAECTLCHVGFPKLNSFGFGYKQRGYRMEDTDGMWVWDGGVQFAGMMALGIMSSDMNMSMPAMQDTKKFKVNIGELEFFSGGNLAPKVSYFLDFAYEDDGTVGRGGSFVILDDVLPESLLNIKLGAYDSTWYWLNNARKLGMTDYNEAGELGFDGEGIEINGILASDTRYQLGIGNSAVTNTKNSITQYYAVLDQTFEFGGQDQRIGFAYVSNQVGADNDNASGVTQDIGRTTLLGGSVDLNIPIGEQPLNIMFAYFHKNNDETNTANDADGNAFAANDYNHFIVEGVLPIGEKVILQARYDNVNFKGGKTDDVRTYHASGHYYFAPNVDLVLDYSSTKTWSSEMAYMEMDMLMLMFHLGF